jgi:hypothetical protein
MWGYDGPIVVGAISLAFHAMPPRHDAKHPAQLDFQSSHATIQRRIPESEIQRSNHKPYCSLGYDILHN